MDGTVIVADDDRTIRTVLSQALTRAGCRVRATSTVSTLWQWVEAGEGDVVVSDVMMPDGDALDLIPAIRRKRPDLPIIVMSAQNTIMTAIRATEAGAYEYLPKPFDLRDVLAHVRKALSLAPNKTSQTQEAPPRDQDGQLPLVGHSPAMQEVYRILARLMNTDLSVLITGENGTGKELAAKTLHRFGHRSANPFVSVNFGALQGPDMETALFGRGDQPGKLEAAADGTLFLDEIGDMSSEAQQKLLRVLHDGTFRRIGGDKDIPAKFRLISSSNTDLADHINAGQFREDLFYRLNVVPLRIPPLSERIEDIPELARHFLRKANTAGLPQKTFTQSALDRLKAQRWPGNVRELENFVQRLAALAPTDAIEAKAIEHELNQRPSTAGAPTVDTRQTLSGSVQAHLQRYFDLHGDALPPPGLYHRVLKEIELPLFALALSATRGNQIKAAELLGINRNTLRKKTKELDIRVARGKKLM